LRALQFDRFGEPDVLRVAHVPDPTASSTDAVVAVRAGSVNPSDLKNVAGAMEGTVLPRVPGRDFAGVVLDGPDDWVGTEVWGTGGDIGFTRDGSHAELIGVPVAALTRKPADLSFEQAATVGVNFVVGWVGAVETAQLQAGETIAIFGVSGGVGSAVAQIAHALGARVIGIDRHHPAKHTPAASVLDDFVAATPTQGEVEEKIRHVTGGRGADIVYDTVGGVTTPQALAALADRGRLVVISATGTRTVEVDVLDFYHRELRMLGVDSRKLDVVESAHRLATLTPYFERGQFRPMPVSDVYDLNHGRAAYQAVADHTQGRVVICP
jgi:NADPH:quinone reductase-like Zn-dependent oxidoreductase